MKSEKDDDLSLGIGFSQKDQVILALRAKGAELLAFGLVNVYPEPITSISHENFDGFRKRTS